MPADVRRARILEQIQRDGGASVSELAAAHGVSPITVHRDLESLARDGLVERIRGGARPSGAGHRIHVATDWTKRLRQAAAEKRAIAARAADFVEEGSTIFVDSSTTCLALARHLERHPPRALTLVTNSPAIALELHAQSIHVIVTPGEVDQTLRMIGGRWTTEFLAQINLETAFISAAGATLDKGFTTTRRGLVDTLQAASASASRTIGLLDSSKFGLSALLTIARVEDLDAVIADDGLPAETEDEYRTAGVTLIVAERAPAVVSTTT
jgi:DeoR/GlpR family transcriptional regulator of sugar metabolism